MTGDKGNVNPHGEIGVDAVALTIVTDQTECGTNNTIATLPLTDTFDAGKLAFVSSVPASSSYASTSTPYANTGIVRWDNLGPLAGGQTRDVVVTMRALDPLGSSIVVTNTATVTNATYASGRPLHGAEDEVPVTIYPTGIISGVIWSDSAGTSGTWTDQTGYDGTDYFLANAEVTLWACLLRCHRRALLPTHAHYQGLQWQ